MEENENKDNEIIFEEAEDLLNSKPLIQAEDPDGNIIPRATYITEYTPTPTDKTLTPFGLSKYTQVGNTQESTYDFFLNNFGISLYMPGDDTEELNKIKTRKGIETLQTQLEDAGLLKDGSYTKGFVDTSTRKGFQALLGDANSAGKDWKSTLNFILTNPKYDTSDLPDKLELDYADLTNQVLNTVKSVVGRAPTDNELEILTGILADFKQEQFEGELTNAEIAAQPQYKRETLELSSTGGPTVTVPTGVLQKTELEGFVTPSNAEAKFQSKVNELFKPEMDFNQRREQTRNVANIIKSSVAGLRSIGG
tara:strand:- start:1774 stop:2700 length:927 start_codon:yes stop_codon:yes gene_type:complete